MLGGGIDKVAFFLLFCSTLSPILCFSLPNLFFPNVSPIAKDINNIICSNAQCLRLAGHYVCRAGHTTRIRIGTCNDWELAGPHDIDIPVGSGSKTVGAQVFYSKSDDGKTLKCLAIENFSGPACPGYWFLHPWNVDNWYSLVRRLHDMLLSQFVGH